MLSKNKRQLKKKTPILALILIAFFLIPLSFNFSTLNDGFSKRSEKEKINGEIIEQPSLSANEITIKTPENKTYTNAMSGYYPATYGFENDKNGIVPKEWTSLNYPNIFSNVTDEVDGHKKVIEFYDNTVAKGCRMNNTFAPQTSGTVEFYWRGGAENSLVWFYNGPTEVIYMQYDIYWGDYRMYDGITYQSVMGGIPEDTWYHHRIEFNCATHKFNWYINGVLRGSNKDFRNDENQIDRIILGSRDDQANFYTYYDAFGYSWDPNYNVGANAKEGLLLSFENSTNLNWMGYSLDGAANKTISGNATIPMPVNGTHTIQLFCNDTSGNYYDSELIYFTVNIAQTPPTPINSVSSIGSGGDDGGGGDGTTTNDSSIFLIILVVIIAALVGTFSYVLYRYHSKGPKPEKKKIPKPKKEKKPKPPKQKKVKKPIKGVIPGIIFCPYCFNENPSTAEYCSYCGINFKEAEEKKDTLQSKVPVIKKEQTYVEEQIDIKNLLNKDVIVNILRLKGDNPQNFEELLSKIFKNKEEKELIRVEISRVPEGTFKDFLIAYEKITKELESKKPEHDFNNENYFNEGRGK